MPKFNNINITSNSEIKTPDISKWKKVTVYNSDFTPHLKAMADVIEKLELWDWLKNNKPPEDSGYMFWNHEIITKISNNIENNPHSGATFAFALRTMQSIAQNGFDNWNNNN